MALHASKMAAATIGNFLGGSLSRDAMESAYEKEWNRAFSRRMRMGRLLQSLGSSGNGPGEFVGPKGVAIDPTSGRLYALRRAIDA